MGREVRRVPLDFVWPIDKIWAGFVNPHWVLREKCPVCAGSGSAPDARRFYDEWYGKAPFDPVAYGATPLTKDNPEIVKFATRQIDRDPDFYLPFHRTSQRSTAIHREIDRVHDLWKGQWCHHLIQADVDALLAASRLLDFTHTWTKDGWQPIDPPPVVTPDMVNVWSLSGMGHDAIDQWVCLRARCEREGVPTTCERCDGAGDAWPFPKAKADYAAWTPTPPPEGEGYQLWETVTEGSPQSPVFQTAEELVNWLVEESGYDRDVARKFVAAGWAMSAAVIDGQVMDGITAMGTKS